MEIVQVLSIHFTERKMRNCKGDLRIFVFGGKIKTREPGLSNSPMNQAEQPWRPFSVLAISLRLLFTSRASSSPLVFDERNPPSPSLSLSPLAFALPLRLMQRSTPRRLLRAPLNRSLSLSPSFYTTIFDQFCVVFIELIRVFFGAYGTSRCHCFSWLFTVID